MRWAAGLLIGFVFFSCLKCSNGPVPSKSNTPQDRKAPDVAWDGWWPKKQWVVDDRPPAEADVRAVGRAWKDIDCHSVETPWGEAHASMGKIEMAPGYAPRPGIVFWLSFSRPSNETVMFEKGELEAYLVGGSKEVLKPTNGDPVCDGGIGRSGMITTSVGIEFAWFADDLADRCIQLKMKDRTAWILVPYGFGADDSKPAPAMAPVRDAPALPPGYRKGDQLVAWKEVRYELGGPWSIQIQISNSLDCRGRMTLHRGDSKDWNTWAVSRPRTTMAIGIPRGRVLVSTCRSVNRGDDNRRREDRFEFNRQPQDDRGWALLRVTVEEEVYERAIPSSLFLYGHGQTPKGE